jgi:hypothetical protein
LLNDLYEFDFKNLQWELINPELSNINGRFDHKSIVIDNVLYIFGGKIESLFAAQLYALKLKEIPISTYFTKEFDQRDMIVRLKDGEIPCHKFLMSRFHIFRIKNEFPEITCKTFSKVLEYIYTCDLGIDSLETLIEIVVASHILEMVELEKYCCVKSISVITEKDSLEKLKNYKELKNVQLLTCQRFENQLKNDSGEFTKFLEENIVSFKNDNSWNFNDYLLHLYQSKSYFDIGIVCSDGVVLYAHKALLLCYSSFFKENTKLLEFEGDLMRIVLDKMYGKQITLPDYRMTMKLIHLLSFLKIDQFLDHFVNHLISLISILNVNLVSKWNKDFSIHSIEKKCQEMISNFYFKHPKAFLRMKNFEIQKKIFSMETQIQEIQSSQSEIKLLLK